MNDTYNIYRYYQEDRPSRKMRSGLTLKQAQDHCSKPETSSSTHPKGRNGCTSEWFDGYTKA